MRPRIRTTNCSRSAASSSCAAGFGQSRCTTVLCTHTHNGNDAVHYCHNQLVGNYFSTTLADYINHFCMAWQNERTRQSCSSGNAVQLEKVVRGHIQKVKNFTRTENNDVPIRA